MKIESISRASIEIEMSDGKVFALVEQNDGGLVISRRTGGLEVQRTITVEGVLSLVGGDAAELGRCLDAVILR